MLNKILLEKLMPVTPEEQDIIDRGKIDRRLYMDTRDDVVNSKCLLEIGRAHV